MREVSLNIEGKTMGLWSKLFGPDPGYAGDTNLQTSSDPRRPVNYSDWQISDSCLTLLRQCTCPRAIEELAKDSILANAFSESMDQVVESLKNVGALVECDDPAARIAYNRGAVALRQLCIDNGFKKIGTKDDMARRLVGIDPMGTRLGYAGRLFVCSEMAAAVIEAERKAYRASQLDDPLLRDLFTRTDFDVEKQRLTRSWKQPPSDDDVKLSLLNRRIVEHAKMGERAICSSLYYTMSLFESRRGHYEHALKLAFIVCADDLCGVSNGGGFNPTLAMLPPRSH